MDWISCLGSHNDSRMNIALAITAARQGATIANHIRVVGLVKDENGKLTAVSLRDELTGTFPIQFKLFSLTY